MAIQQWSVLIVSTGYGNELLRSTVDSELRRLGFGANVYDGLGYPVDPALHSHAACIKAIHQNDIVVAFADEGAGGEFQTQHVPAEMVAELRSAGVLETDAADSWPSIFHVEVLTSRHIGKPTLVFIPKQVESKVREVLGFLRSGALTVRPRPGTDFDPAPLIASGDWGRLNRHFVVPAASMEFQQIVFLERLRKESPNFISYYDKSNLQELTAKLRERLAGVAHNLIRRHVSAVQDRIEKQRSPLNPLSLQDLYQRGLIVSPLVRTLSGPPPTEPLFSAQADRDGEAAAALRQRKSVLLLGDPGMGKSTACFFTFRDLARGYDASVNPPAPLLASWRELPGHLTSAQAVIRFMLGLPMQREPWPASLDLPNVNWVLVLDGLDESHIERGTAIKLLQKVGSSCTLMVSCRRHDYAHSYAVIRDSFNTIVELLPWGPSQLTDYIDHLRAAGMQGGAALLEKWRLGGQVPALISFPLWASMIAFLGQREPERPDGIPATEYELLQVCSEGVADDEIRRQGASTSPRALRSLWMQSAWLIHRARRERLHLPLASLLQDLGVTPESAMEKAVCSFLDTSMGQVHGFFHEVFQEYWLAEHIIAELTTEGRETDSQGCFSINVLS